MYLWVGHLHRIHEALGSVPAPHKPSVAAQASNPKTPKAEAGGAGVQGHSRLYNELKAKWDYMRLCLNR